MANRLARETSPYLLQHKDNPVDWFPWGEEAFALAKAADKPVFLSIGYSSCHWCHVMEHESFEDKGVAAILNEAFVSVKVDREERPDVDEAYMTAVQLATGRGGWPMTVFLTPDKKPFFAGTYFPREDRSQHPGFVTICRQIASLWQTKRAEIEENAAEFSRGLSEAMGRHAPAPSGPFDEEFLASGVKALAADFDNQHGGFGGAPKFPPHTSIDFLMRYAMRPESPEELREIAIGMAFSTLEQMALGGICDHVGGGFHRYSTDAEWLLPHFEKMLYDNALMLGNYSLAASMLHGVDQGLEDFYGDVAARTARWVWREMTSPEGCFYSAIDADSEGVEGKFYVWTTGEVRSLWQDEEIVQPPSGTAETFIAVHGLKDEGNFRDEASGKLTGENVIHLQERSEDYSRELALLLAKRNRRVRPSLDDKVLVSWNGLMIRAMAESRYITYAAKAAEAILEAERAFGSLPHQIVEGVPTGRAFLDDYAACADGLFAIAAKREYFDGEGLQIPAGKLATAEYRAHAERLTRRMIELFWDEEEGGFFSTSSGHEDLFGRSKPVFDSPTPSANAIALRCLVAIGDSERADRLIKTFLGWMERAPQATEALYAAALPLAQPSTDSPTHQLTPSPKQGPAVRLGSKEIVADASGVGRGEVVIAIPDGLHINSNDPPARWLTPTALAFQPMKAEVDYPEAVNYAYEGEVRIPFRIALPAGSTGEEFEVRVSYQACTDTECLAPAEKTLSGVVVRV